MNANPIALRSLVGSFTLALLFSTWPAHAAGAPDPAIVKSEFIFRQAPFQHCEASTLVATPSGLLAAWAGGSRAGALNVSIWLSRHDATGWKTPIEVANGDDEKNQRRYPCWNPVLFRRHNGDLLLFYKVGLHPYSWWGMVRLSLDDGQTWSRTRRLPHRFFGPDRNPPIELRNGLLVCPSSSRDRGWRVHIEQTEDPFSLWARTPALNSAVQFSAIQPTILQHAGQKLQILCRTKQGIVTQCWSTNDSVTWMPMERTVLPNPNSALDGIRLADGRFLLVYNHSEKDRHVLNVAISKDGEHWQAGCVLENEPGSEFSDPAVIQTSDGLVHITYTWKGQRIKYVVLDPTKLHLRPMLDGHWPGQ